MRTLSSTLLAAQQASSRQPFVKIEAGNKPAGVVKLKWDRLYTGSEPDSPCSMTIPGDGSLVRVRVTLASDSHKLYRQRVVSPGPGSDFSQWAYLNRYGVMAAAVCSKGAEVSLFWAEDDASINYSKSLDYGLTWSSVVYLGSAPMADISCMAAAYKPNNDLAVFYGVSSRLFITQRLSGVWQSRVEWNKTTGRLTGSAVVYDGDWKLLISGQDFAGDLRVWSLIYGDGDEVTAGSWSDLKKIISAPYGGDFTFNGVSLDHPSAGGVYRCFFIEKFSGSDPCSRPYWSHSLPETGFLLNRWREPVPFNLEGEYVPAMAHTSDYAWLSTPWGVWRASLEEETLDLSADILSLEADLSQDSGKLVAELRNDDGRYAAPGGDDLAVLERGCRLDFSPGYRSLLGNEYSAGLSFTLQGWEYTSLPGKSAFVLYAEDGWNSLEKWTARYQLRWNQPDQYGDPVQEAAVKEILAQVLARSGLCLSVISQSTAATGLYPDFTVHAGDNGRAAVARLLSFVPDELFIEGDIAYLVNPLETDSPVYSYGPSHIILEGRYRQDAWKINRVQVEGLNPVGPAKIVVDSFDWDEIGNCGDRLEILEDLNVTTVALAQGRGAAYLRRVDMESVAGLIRAPVNCGQQMYDVIDITDPRAGLSATPRRVLGIGLSYQPQKGQYEQQIKLGAV